MLDSFTQCASCNQSYSSDSAEDIAPLQIFPIDYAFYFSPITKSTPKAIPKYTKSRLLKALGDSISILYNEPIAVASSTLIPICIPHT